MTPDNKLKEIAERLLDNPCLCIDCDGPARAEVALQQARDLGRKEVLDKANEVLTCGEPALHAVDLKMRIKDEIAEARDLGRGEKHECSFSTGIDGSITAGTGDLDENGYWSKPCEPCTAWANKCEQARDLGRRETLAEPASIPGTDAAVKLATALGYDVAKFPMVTQIMRQHIGDAVDAGREEERKAIRAQARGMLGCGCIDELLAALDARSGGKS